MSVPISEKCVVTGHLEIRLKMENNTGRRKMYFNLDLRDTMSKPASVKLNLDFYILASTSKSV
jgi:hypothetical protein